LLPTFWGCALRRLIKIYDILVLGATEKESSAIQAPKKAQAIQNDSFTRRIMNIL
jgi:hypothetical protein